MSDEPNTLYRREANAEDGTPIVAQEWDDVLDLILGEPLADGRVVVLSKLDAAALGGVLTRWAES
jgi:hypothetical protein